MTTARIPMAIRTVLRRPQALCASVPRVFPLRLRRCYATEPRSSNPTSSFYKTFSRPVAKVLVLAIFTYQVAYWTWLKLEFDETCAETDATIQGLEKTVDEYKASKKR